MVGPNVLTRKTTLNPVGPEARLYSVRWHNVQSHLLGHVTERGWQASEDIAYETLRRKDVATVVVWDGSVQKLVLIKKEKA